MNRRQLERRRFLQAVGSTALTYPFLRALPSYAQQTSAPHYLILVFTPCGVVRYNWGALGPARGTGTTIVTSPLTGASGAGMFRPTLQPLTTGTDLTAKTIVLDGLNVGTANGSHEAGMAALWTGCYSSGSPATTISIDQAIAAQVSVGRPFSSIPLMVRSSQDFSDREVKTRMIYTATGGFVDPYDDPVTARSTFFPTTATSGAEAGPDPRTAIRGLVFTQLNKELSALQPRLCTQDRQQLQTLQAAWNELDTQLSNAAMAAQSCMTPEAPDAGYTSPSIDFPTSAKLQMDILALALACDLTRVASLQFSTATSQVTHSWIGATQTDIHHNYSHDGPTSLYSLLPDLYTTSEYNGGSGLSSFPPQYSAQLPAIDLWYAQQLAYLGNRLGSLQTASGASLLDQSVICCGSELDMGAAHNHDDTPFILIGGGGGKLKTGQLVQFPLNLSQYDANSPPTGNRFHNDLLLTLAQVMGVNMTTFGTPAGVPPNGNGTTFQFVTGPIQQILA
jgi:hypothetical protein